MKQQSAGLVNPFRNIYFTFVLAGARAERSTLSQTSLDSEPHNPFCGTGFRKPLQSRPATESFGR
jgi:hypothetical protein